MPLKAEGPLFRTGLLSFQSNVPLKITSATEK